MTHIRRLTAGLIVTLVAAATSTNVSAQTTAPGAYYAPPAWSQTLPGSTRFIVLSNFNGEAVLDRETGLVWQRTPRRTQAYWEDAQNVCYHELTGGRRGWRLPTYPELGSLLDPAQFGPALPPNHPFQDVLLSEAGPRTYWTATEAPRDPDNALVVDIADGLRDIPKSEARHYWCVRGGSGAVNP